MKKVIDFLIVAVPSTLGVLFVAFFMWYIMFVTTIEKHEFGYCFDRISGNIEVFTNSGWVVRAPFRYSVHTIDLRPIQITISANQRVLNAKLVKFNPDGIKCFIEWHGRGAGQQVWDLAEILKCYAFDKASGEDCPFLEVVQEIAPNQSINIQK